MLHLCEKDTVNVGELFRMAENEPGGIIVRKPWDKRMKRLFWETPQDYVTWLFPGAQFQDSLSTELENETLYADLLFAVILNGIRILLHIEFQYNRDSKMAERVWQYNMKASLKYKCAVWSVIIYLKNDGIVANTPLMRKLPDGRGIHRFDFDVIKLWEISIEELRTKGLIGLLPLLPLTKGGAKREVIEETIGELAPAGEEPKAELLALTYGIASLALENTADQEWLIRRFTKMYDILRETRAYQDLTKESRQEALEEGHKKGLKEGLQLGKVEALHLTVLDVVRKRFPKLTRFAKEQIAAIDDSEVLRRLIVKISIAKTMQEARQALLTVDEDEDLDDE